MKGIAINDLSGLVHWVNIKVTTQRGGMGHVVEYMEWVNLPFDVRLKWDWYFRYRAALLQVKYPKMLVDIAWGNTSNEHSAEVAARNKLVSLKRKLTKKLNAYNLYLQEFEDYKNNYSLIFPIENEMKYKEYLHNIDRCDAVIESLKLEYSQLGQTLSS